MFLEYAWITFHQKENTRPEDQINVVKGVVTWLKEWLDYFLFIPPLPP
jgi:hypothetical protein